MSDKRIQQNTNNMGSNTLFTKAIAHKRAFQHLNCLLEDKQLQEHFAKYPDQWQSTRLTLTSVLVHNSPLLTHLEENLKLFTYKLSPRQKRDLSVNLLNGSNQFLHTLSELGLARAFYESGWQVELAVQFWDKSKKDVDLRVKKDITEALIEVINLQANELHIRRDGFFGLSAPNVLHYNLIDKVVEKYKSKFQEAIQNGWSGPAYIALDISKDDALQFGLAFREGPLREEWQGRCAAEVVQYCPGLHGVIYYYHSADEPGTRAISWK